MKTLDTLLALLTLNVAFGLAAEARPPKKMDSSTFVRVGEKVKDQTFFSYHGTNRNAKTLTHEFNQWDAQRGDYCEEKGVKVDLRKKQVRALCEDDTLPFPLTKGCNLEAIYLGRGNTIKELKRLLHGGCASLEQKTPHFEEALETMWEYKTQHRAKHNGAAKQSGVDKLSDYNKNKQLMSLNHYINIADTVAKETFRKLDWHKVGKEYKLNEVQTTLLKRAMGFIAGKELVAYGMTELLPSSNGQRNARVLDYLFHTAGATYLDNIPALYDDRSSNGIWQFTSYALCDTPRKKEGASIVNQYLPKEMQIPGSVNKLETKDHIRAAYLFATHNLALLLRKANSRELRHFDKYLARLEKGSGDDDLVQFMATAHHLPSVARRNAHAWLLADKGHDFSQFCHGALREYALKTKANYQGLNQ